MRKGPLLWCPSCGLYSTVDVLKTAGIFKALVKCSQDGCGNQWWAVVV